MAMTYGHVYGGQLAMGASQEQTLRAFLEASRLSGALAVSLALFHCIAMASHAQGRRRQRGRDSGRCSLTATTHAAASGARIRSSSMP